MLERLAVGGMAEVYLAKCFGVAGFERLVALKRILPTIAEDDEFIAMFIDEAKIAGQLNHNNVAQIFDLGKINNSYFIAMEYISGHDLRALWDKKRHDGDHIPIELACYAVKKICEGLDYAHRRRDNRGRPLGIIHRDVSPQNVLLSYDGDVKVIDFGIAKAANRMVRTQTGILKGKFAYMAPEQTRGEPTDHRSDVFAIGVMLYELLTGERAFKAESDFALLEKVRKVDLVPPRKLKADIPRELERIIYKAMSREASDRYAWASVMASDLDRFMSNHGLTYNKEEISAYVRKTFREDYDEEKRRLAVYKTFRLDEGEGASGEGDDDELEGTLDGTYDASLHVLSDEDGVSPDQATQLKGDPSLALSSDEEAIYEAGTELGDPYADDDSDALASAEPDGDDGAAQGFFEPESTRMIDDEGDSVEETNTSNEHPAGHRAATKAVSFTSRLDDSAEADSLLGGSAFAAQERPQPHDVSHEASTRVFSQEDLESSDAGDATMVDSSPISDESDASDASAGEGAGQGRAPAPQRGRGTALGDVVGDTADTDPPPSAGTVPRARQHHDANLFSGPNRASPPRTQSSRGSSSPSNSAPVPEAFDPPLPPEKGAANALPVMLGALGLLLGIVVSLPVGTLVGLAFGDSHNTIIVASPRSAAVKIDNETVCERTPCTLDLDIGKHEVVFMADGYDSFATAYEIMDIPDNLIDVKLLRRQTELMLKTDPPGAKVTFKGKTLTGVTPLTLPDLTVGDKVNLKLRLRGYDSVDETVVVPELSPEESWDFKLISSQTRWSLTVLPKDALVELPDGRFKEGPTKIRVKRARAVAVRVVRPGCEPENLSLQGTGRPEEEQSVTLKCRPLDGKLTVRSKTRLMVSLDNIDLGKRWLSGYPLPEGEWNVTLRSRRGRQEKATVIIRRGQVFELPTSLRW